ncbi:MAG TPA: TetR/AcrR family transcriptional regulator [Ktedonobacterales bacterium]|jgi:AcrR family transcriptional regulator
MDVGADGIVVDSVAADAESLVATLPRARRGRPPGYRRTDAADAQTHERVLRHARALFLRRGYADVSVGEIAAAVGVSKPTLYYHFGAKEGLYAAVLLDVLREVGGYIRAVTQAPLTVGERLYELALGYFRHADTTLEPTLRDADALLGPDWAARVRTIYNDEIVAPIERMVRTGIQCGELRPADSQVAARAFLVLLDGFTARGGHTARTDAEHQAVAASVMTLYLDGVAVPRTARRSVLSS